MKGAHRKTRAHDNPREAHAQRVRRRNRRLLLRGAVAFAVLAPLGAVGIGWYQRRAAGRRDLSVIGNGTPTVVQVYDYGNRSSRELWDSVVTLEREFAPRVQFRIADRATPDGALLASRYNAGPSTLLLFGPDGRLRDTLAGTQDPQAIRAAIAATFPASRAPG